jgi:hypothetical protein
VDSSTSEARYLYDRRVGRYRDVETGRFVAQKDLPWPAKRGFASSPQDTLLGKGERIDRFGKLSGSYAGTPGSSISERGMPPGSEDLPYTQLEVLKPITVPAGPAAVVKDFGAAGGATQYYFKGGIQKWIDQGYLKVIK